MTICGGITLGGIIATAGLTTLRRSYSGVLALLMCFAGDALLNCNGGWNWNFAAGVAAFALAQISFIGYALRRGAHFKPQLAVMVLPLYLLYYGLWLYPVIDEALIRNLVLIYLVLSIANISFTAGLPAVCRGKILMVAAIAALLVSDTIISLNIFLRFSELNIAMLPLYGLSQLLYSAGLIMNERFAPSAGPAQ